MPARGLFIGFAAAAFLISLSCSKSSPTQPTDSTGSVSDGDGNVYRTVKIGSQWWMATNLKVAHYRNGDSIPAVTDSASWGGLTTGACCSYNNDTATATIYGRLYNWYAIADGRNIAPAGWHVATDSDYALLVNYLGGDTVAGGKMKEAGTAHWQNPNTGASNQSGFSGLPEGYRYHTGYFYDVGGYATFWSSTPNTNDFAWYYYLSYNDAQVSRVSYYKSSGFSVRCVKD